MDIRLKRTHFAALAGLAVAPWLVAATIDAANGGNNDTIVNITGYGAAPQEVQVLTMSAGLETFATSAGSAMARNSRGLADIRAALARHGIDPKDVRTGQLYLQPGEKDEKFLGTERKVKGFRVQHTLMIIFRDLAKAGAVMDTLVAAGATQISGPNFSYEARPETQAPARLAAIRDADARAQFFAKALGMRVKRVVTMSDGGGYSAPRAMAYTADVAPGTQISPGQDQVRVTVNAQYELTR